MTESLPSTSQSAHRDFSVQCFNAAWELLDRQDRSSAEDLEMLLRAATSLWHWTQRADVTPRSLSIGNWQMARVLALIGHGPLARQFGRACRDAAPADDPFCQGYACECLARACAVDGQWDEARQLIHTGEMLAAQVSSDGDREILLTDLRSISLA